MSLSFRGKDVYKRQVHRVSLRLKYWILNCKKRMKTQKDETEKIYSEKSKCKKERIWDAVSYTHLDVYKRQGSQCERSAPASQSGCYG